MWRYSPSGLVCTLLLAAGCADNDTDERGAHRGRDTLEGRGIAAGYLFPRPIDPARAVNKDLVRQWLRQAERLAELEPQQGSAWHAYRRGWATARKHLPLADIAAAGGWKGTEALQRCYLHADDETMLAVVMSGTQLREVRKA